MLTEQPGLTPQDYADALQAPSARSVLGLAGALHAVLPKIWADARVQGRDAAWVNQHPIVRLYAEQLAWLSGAGGTLDPEAYARAQIACQAAAAGRG